MSQTLKHEVSALYQRSVLDPVVEVARGISHDFASRPRHYRAIPEDLSTSLDDFRSRIGSSPEWPSAAQRAELFAPLFGDTFRTTSAALRCAAVAFVERSGNASPHPLEDRVRDAAISLRGYLKSIQGRAVSRADAATGRVFQRAVDVLRNSEVAGSFGLPPAPRGKWPLDGALDKDVAFADGAVLVEEIQRPVGIRSTISQHQFILLQRVAHYGALTIAGVLGDDDDWDSAEWIHPLVRYAYGWETALRSPLFYNEDRAKSLQPRVVSQIALDDEELKSLPTEQDSKTPGVLAMIGGGGGAGLNVTCNTGVTRICDNPHSPTTQNHSCTYGSTWYCNTGPTCTSGWTYKCDIWHVGVIRSGLDEISIGGISLGR